MSWLMKFFDDLYRGVLRQFFFFFKNQRRFVSVYNYLKSLYDSCEDKLIVTTNIEEVMFGKLINLLLGGHGTHVINFKKINNTVAD